MITFDDDTTKKDGQNMMKGSNKSLKKEDDAKGRRGSQAGIQTTRLALNALTAEAKQSNHQSSFIIVTVCWC